MATPLTVAETASVIIQRTVFKYRKNRHGVDYARANRVFLRAPLHHHFEMKGWRETQVVVRFWILAGLSTAIALGLYLADFIHLTGQ